MKNIPEYGIRQGIFPKNMKKTINFLIKNIFKIPYIILTIHFKDLFVPVGEINF
jgi:hypothetical protein